MSKTKAATAYDAENRARIAALEQHRDHPSAGGAAYPKDSLPRLPTPAPGKVPVQGRITAATRDKMVIALERDNLTWGDVMEWAFEGYLKARLDGRAPSTDHLPNPKPMDGPRPRTRRRG